MQRSGCLGGPSKRGKKTGLAACHSPIATTGRQFPEWRIRTVLAGKRCNATASFAMRIFSGARSSVLENSIYGRLNLENSRNFQKKNPEISECDFQKKAKSAEKAIKRYMCFAGSRWIGAMLANAAAVVETAGSETLSRLLHYFCRLGSNPTSNPTQQQLSH